MNIYIKDELSDSSKVYFAKDSLFRPFCNVSLESSTDAEIEKKNKKTIRQLAYSRHKLRNI